MSAPAHKTAPAQARREVEARTGTCQNMRTLGYRAAKYALTGHPTRFESRPRGRNDTENWIIQRTIDKRWRVACVEPEGMRWPNERKVDSPLFDGPVAAALWLHVEKANGTVRFS